MTHDPIVYDLDGHEYAMLLVEPTDDGVSGWVRWPAEAHGWTQRRRMPEPSTELLLDFWEMPPFNARLALRLSGAAH